MARAIWSGAISFGLVNIPVKLYSAVSKKTVRFHQLDSKDNARIQQKRVNPNTGEEVPYEQLVKGYELSPDRYVVITPEELDSIEPKKTRAIDIEDFVEIDRDRPHLLRPPLLPRARHRRRQALQAAARGDEGRRAGGDRPRGDPLEGEAWWPSARASDVLTMETLLFGDEVVSPGGPRRARGGGRRQGDQEGGRRWRASSSTPWPRTSTRPSTATSTATPCST